MRVPRATYRLQFNRHFRLADGLALVPYLHELGISHIYASPLFKATPGSLHGYDVCDFNELNPELGTEEDLSRLADALHGKGMGLVVDIVPNHMGISSPENRWWWDVLANGEKSLFAGHFDINWRPADEKLPSKVLIPVLGNEYETVLKRGEIQLLWENGRFVLGYHEHRFPIAEATAAGLPHEGTGLKAFNADTAALDGLIRRQNYRLAFHGRGDAELNYRRFFAVSSLAAVRVEEEEVFETTHVLLRKWLDKGWIDGLRVDHPDGLRDPAKYLERLRAIAPRAWMVVEKILGAIESLPTAWPIQGTTGYDFLNQVNGLFINRSAESALTDLYSAFAGETEDFTHIVAKKKRMVLGTLLAAELNRLASLLAEIAGRDETGKSFSGIDLREALAETVVCFPVYRTYVSGSAAPDDADAYKIEAAAQLACEHRKDLHPELFVYIEALLVKPQASNVAREFVARFQQLTGAVMAKGAEDTVFYCFNRFVSLNEVGGDPDKFGVGLEDFHHFLAQQQETWPYTQLTTSTHDTKRAEDVRARLNVLTEIPEQWTETVRRWSAKNERYRQNNFPDPNAEYLLYQTLVGAWPISEERVQAYMEKAVHEAKQHTDWTKRNVAYEEALRGFISNILHDAEFVEDVKKFAEGLAEAAAVNSLAQILIKLTAPGVPDIYQGCELWDLSLVDPDNRRPVDFTARQRFLTAIDGITAAQAWVRRPEGFCKLWLIQKTLKIRARLENFCELDYQPAYAHGAKQEHVAAFTRGDKAMTIVPRFWLKLNNDWQDTVLTLPDGSWQNEFTGETFRGEVGMADLLREFPVTLLLRKENE